jgi:hypothetical protein
MKRITVFLTVLVVVATLFAGCAQSDTPSITPDQTTPETAPIPEQTTPKPTPTPGLTTPDATPAPGPTEQPSIPGASTGTLTVLVTDAPGYQVESVTVYFSEVEVHVAADGEGGKGGWIPLKLNVPDGTFGDTTKEIVLHEDMEPVTLAAGQLDLELDGTIQITQIRVHMDENKGVTVLYIPDPEDPETKEPVSAKLPSGELRFVRPFVMSDAGATIGLDFQVQDSVVWPGAFGKEDQGKDPIFKPVVKLEVTPQGDQDNQGTLLLENKDPDTWQVIVEDESEDEIKGTLTYNLSGETFDFVFVGEGLEDTNYSLIYYADYYESDEQDRYTTWGGNYPGALIASGNAVDGTLELSGSLNLRPDLTPGEDEDGIDLPWPPDGNIEDYHYDGPPDYYDHANGAKIWLVPSECYEAGTPGEPVCQVTKWEPDRFLFETDLITFDDTNNEREPLE